MWPCKSVVCRIEIQILSESTSAAAFARVGTALSSPASPTSFKKSRLVQSLSESNILLRRASGILIARQLYLNENARAWES